MQNCEVLVVGAGATGLMAARELLKAGKSVTVLEARDHCGGRIHTVNSGGFTQNVELGAEFIHGDLPVTQTLLKEAVIPYHHTTGEMWHYRNGKFDTDAGMMQHWDLLVTKLKNVKKDITINEFLEKEFPGEKYDGLKRSVRSFASGYDTADPDKASTFALRYEWLSDNEEHTYRLDEGYGKMIAFLEEDIENAGGHIKLNSIVKEVSWHAGNVKVTTADAIIYTAGKVIIALPLGVLQTKGTASEISFKPPITQQMEAINQMGFGSIIKILLEFDTLFWEDEQTKSLTRKDPKKMGFLLSDEEIPTWWTQLPKHSPVLTGWLGGPAAAKMKDESDNELLNKALQSLGNIYKRPVEELKNKLIAFNIANWTNDLFTLGSYAYDTVDAHIARETLKKPVEDTIFFAGEYLYEGHAMGTVEAALTSGKEAAGKVLKAV